MNTISAVIGVSLNQILYRFNKRNKVSFLDLISVPTQPKIDRLSFQREAADAIAFANAKANLYNDLFYKSLCLRVGDIAFL